MLEVRRGAAAGQPGARFIAGRPALLPDEPTASLDLANRGAVIDMVREAKAAGAARVGIFHDASVRDAIADRELPIHPLQEAA